MIQSNVAPQYKRIPRYHHRSHTNLYLKQAKNIKLRHLRGEHAQLFLNWIEKSVLIIGAIITIGLMLVLVSTKITDDVYQHQIINVDDNISKFHNLNNNYRQEMSNLQSRSRLQKIARDNHLKFSSHDVRNVK